MGDMDIHSLKRNTPRAKDTTMRCRRYSPQEIAAMGTQAPTPLQANILAVITATTIPQAANRYNRAAIEDMVSKGLVMVKLTDGTLRITPSGIAASREYQSRLPNPKGTNR